MLLGVGSFLTHVVQLEVDVFYLGLRQLPVLRSVLYVGLTLEPPCHDVT